MSPCQPTRPGTNTGPQFDVDDLSDDTLALRLSAERFCGEWLYVHAWRTWMRWTGERWEMVHRLEHFALIREFLRDQARVADDKNRAVNLRSAKKAYAIEQMVRANPEVAAGTRQWDGDPWLLGTPGGTVNLRTGELRPARRGEYLTKHTAVAPAEPGADCPIWRGFLDRIFRSEPDIVPFLQRVAGYALTGQTTEHKLLFLFGKGRNGKGTFCDTLTGILADYSTISSAATFLDSGMSSHPTGIASLAGARLVTASELPANRSWNDALLKSLTGGDPITARRMRQDEFTFDPQCTLLIAGNHMPPFHAVDDAMRARLLLVPFREHISAEERDRNLKSKLRSEWPAILRWAIDGAVEWQNIGLDAPRAVQTASENYLDDEDLLGEFMTDCLRESPGSIVATGMLYSVFTRWCDQRGMRPWSQHAMRTALKERGYVFGRKTHARGLKGYSLARDASNACGQVE